MSAGDDKGNRRYFSTGGINFDDDASIAAFALQVWQAFADQSIGDDMTKKTAPATPSVMLTPRYTAALDYAAAIHGTHVRKGTDTTYLSHLLGVSSLVLEAGGSEDEAIAGLLHDAVEDAGGMPRAANIRAHFGDRVADIVLACSDSTDEEWKRSVDYWERKQAYLNKVSASDDRGALLVSIADKVHNARAIVTDIIRSTQTQPRIDPLAKFNGSPKQIHDYYSQLLQTAKDKGVPDTLTIPLQLAVERIAEHISQTED